LASADRRGVIKLWKAGTGGLFATLPAHTYVGAVVLSWLDGKTLVSATENATGSYGEVQLWDRETRTLRRTLGVPGYPGHPVAFSPDGRILAAGSTSGSVRLWNLSSGKQHGSLP